MPPEANQTREKAPTDFSFTDGFIKEDEKGHLVDAEGKRLSEAEGVKKSFMGSGESALNDPNAPDQTDRKGIVSGVRDSLLTQMKAENEASIKDASDMQDEHMKHKAEKMLPAMKNAQAMLTNQRLAWAYLALARARAMNSKIAESAAMLESVKPFLKGENAAEFAEIEKEVQGYQQKPPGLFMSLLARPKLVPASIAYSNSYNQQISAMDKVYSLNDEWNQRLADYHDNRYLEHSRRYDRLFETYYIMTRSGANGEATFGTEETNSGKVNDAKRSIAEYMGRYNQNDVSGFRNNAINDSYSNLRMGLEAVKRPGAGSDNILYSDYFKIHTRATLEGFDPSVHGLSQEQAANTSRVRFKVDSDFKGYAAKNQVDTQGNVTANAGFDKKAISDVGDMNLVANEKGANREYLFSGSSSKIYEVTSKDGKSTVKGMFVKGEFIPSTSSGAITSQADTKEFSGKSLQGMQLDERLRNAIRRSALFRHINSETVGVYMNYLQEPGKKTVAPTTIAGKINAERGALFSLTGLKQGMMNGSIINTIGGFYGATMTDLLPGESEAAYKKNLDQMFQTTTQYYDASSAATLRLKINDNKRKDKYGLNAVDSLSGSLMPVMTVTSSQIPGLGEYTAGLASSTLSMIRNGIILVKSVIEYKTTASDERAGTEIYDMAQTFISMVQSMSDFLKYLEGLLSLGVPALKNVNKYLTGVLPAAKDGIAIIGDAVQIYISNDNIHALDETKEMLENAIKSGTGLGEAASNNSQSKWFLTRVRRQEKNTIVDSSFDIASKGTGIAGSVMGVAKFPFNLISKGIDLIKSLSLRGMERYGRRGDLAEILGDNALVDAPHFDQVLSDETGIKSQYYLPDVIKVFMSIDMHALLNTAQEGTDLQTLAEQTLGTIYKRRAEETFEEFKKRVEFDKLLDAVGAPLNWRDVLFAAIG